MSKHVLFAVLLASAAGVIGWQWRNDKNAARDGRIVLYGNIDIRQVRLGFRVGGRIGEVLRDEGDAVNPGDLLARLDDQPYRDALNLAQAQRASAQAAREKAVNGPRQGEIDQARANVETLRAELDMAERTFTRYQELVRTNAITREAFDQAEATRNAARGRLSASEDALALLVEGTRKEDLAAALAALMAADATVGSAETSLSDTRLIAPAKGVVISRVSEPGAIVAAGETVLVVSLDQPVWARAYVPETMLGLVHPGKEVEAFTDTRPDKPYRGVVGFVSPVAEFTPKSVETPELRTDLVYRIRVVIAQPDSGLRQGMPVTLSMSAGGK